MSFCTAYTVTAGATGGPTVVPVAGASALALQVPAVGLVVAHALRMVLF